jgi:hypothetical protein
MPDLKNIVGPYIVIADSIPLVEFHQESELKKTALMSDDLGGLSKKKEYDEDEPYLPYLKQFVNLHVVCDFSVYESKMQIIPHIKHEFHI